MGHYDKDDQENDIARLDLALMPFKLNQSTSNFLSYKLLKLIRRRRKRKNIRKWNMWPVVAGKLERVKLKTIFK